MFRFSKYRHQVIPLPGDVTLGDLPQRFELLLTMPHTHEFRDDAGQVIYLPYFDALVRVNTMNHGTDKYWLDTEDAE